MTNTKVGTESYGRLSTILDYPDEGFAEKVGQTQQYLDEREPECGRLLRSFTDIVTALPVDQVQELYTRTFDVQAITTLDLGYLLFGDDYKRAELLVNLGREHMRVGNNCGHELADHLPNVIRLLSLLNDNVLAWELVNKLICPGLKKMIREFNPDNVTVKNEVYERHHRTLIELPVRYGTIYQKPLVVLLRLLQRDFGFEDPDAGSACGFLGAIKDEMKLED